MALINTFRNILLQTSHPKFQPSYIQKSSDSKPKNACEVFQNTNKEKNNHVIQCSNSKSLALPEPKRIFFETAENKRKKQLIKCKTILREPETYYLISGVPIEITCFREARVYQPRKNCMQSGILHIRHWEIDFETKGRWENPLMGWCSSGDSLSNVKMKFPSKDEAIEYCKKNNMKYWVQDSKIDKKFKVKSYGINFHYKNRTRVSTK